MAKPPQPGPPPVWRLQMHSAVRTLVGPLLPTLQASPEAAAIVVVMVVGGW